MELITVFSRSTGRLLRHHAGRLGSALLDDDEVAILGECPIDSVLQIAADDFGNELLSAVRCVPPQPPDVPGHEWTFDDAGWSWTSMITLQGARDAKWAQLKHARDAAEVAPLTVAGRTFDADVKSRELISGVIQLVLMASLDIHVQGIPLGEVPTQAQRLAALDASGWAIDWTLADNSVATLTATEVVAVGVAIGAQVSVAHTAGRALRAQIAAATAVAEINAITWSTP